MDIPATETTPETIAPQEPATELPEDQDIEAKIAKLEEEKENYRKAYLKASEKPRVEIQDLSEDERLAHIVDERLAQSRIAEISKEQDELLKKTLKENKELKLAQLNKTNEPPAAVGQHAEGLPVKDTTITADQLAFFKKNGWDDKKIEAYKKNLQRGK